jgi:hypothetical protein
MVDIVGLLIQIVVAVIVIAPILWLVGRSLAGKHNAKFTDAIWIVVLGIVIGTVVGYFISGITAFGGIIASIIMLFVWLGLIKHFFDCGWFKAFAIAIVSVIVFVIIVFLLGLIGIGIGIGLSTLGF